MSYNNGNRSATPQQNSSLLIGILIGIILGLAIAGGVAWTLKKSPGPFMSPEKPAEKSTPEKSISEKPSSSAPASASGAGEDRPRFEFYKELTKQDATLPGQQGGAGALSPEGKSDPASTRAAQEIYFLQVGSFSSAEDADKLKASLAMLGMEASVQIATIPDKGVYHRVRLGPYKGAVEMNKARMTLQQNGVEAAPMRAQ